MTVRNLLGIWSTIYSWQNKFVGGIHTPHPPLDPSLYIMNLFIILVYTGVFLVGLLLILLVAKIVPLNTLCTLCARHSGEPQPQ